jgi:hypothetical protein
MATGFVPTGGCIPEPLCNFTAIIEAETVYDDGSGELPRCLQVSGQLQDGTALPAALVPAEEFVGMNWPLRCWGARAIVSAGQGAKDHLRAAIQQHSPAAARHVVYRQMGWRKLDGAWHYLHAGGP